MRAFGCARAGRANVLRRARVRIPKKQFLLCTAKADTSASARAAPNTPEIDCSYDSQLGVMLDYTKDDASALVQGNSARYSLVTALLNAGAFLSTNHAATTSQANSHKTLCSNRGACDAQQAQMRENCASPCRVC